MLEIKRDGCIDRDRWLLFIHSFNQYNTIFEKVIFVNWLKNNSLYEGNNNDETFITMKILFLM